VNFLEESNYKCDISLLRPVKPLRLMGILFSVNTKRVFTPLERVNPFQDLENEAV